MCVACNAIETARLLLNSASSLFPDGLANSSGQGGAQLRAPRHRGGVRHVRQAGATTPAAASSAATACNCTHSARPSSPRSCARAPGAATAQERQIARLARDGLSDPEIGARLFLSPRTVEWHLRNVFTKLGIRSRRELANALAGPDSQLIPA